MKYAVGKIERDGPDGGGGGGGKWVVSMQS